jgi:pimeloyl-ACP methyl ester carboxylesterase
MVAIASLAVLFAGCSVSADVESLKADAMDSTDTADDPGTDDPGDNDPGDNDPGTDDPGDDDTAPDDESQPDTTDTDDGDEPDVGTLDWGGCEGGGPLTAGFECATLQVPRDYADPDGTQIDIALVRTEASSEDRIGSLLFNPGGPGGSGIEFLTSAAPIIPEELAQRFDLVSFDPRGVGDSTPIDCDVDRDDTAALEAGDDAAWAELVAQAEAGPESCTVDSVDLAAYVGTMNAARDLDEIREALGDEQLSYVGFSYGTRLGAIYADLFPDRVRALVLDGAVKPTSDLSELAEAQASGFDRAFERFAAACDTDADCDVGEAGETLEVYTRLRDELADGATLPTDDPARDLTLGELELGVAAALYSTETWPVLAQALAEADLDDDGSILQAMVDGYVGRRADGTYDDSQSAGAAINCADDPLRPPADDVRARADEVASASTWFAEFLRADTGCLGLPDPLEPIEYGAAADAAPILVIGTTNDPATPYEWSVELADLLESAVLYTVEGDGHTAFLSIDCVNDVVVRYLVELELPDDGSSCADDPDTDSFPPPGEGQFDQVLELFDCLRDNGADIPDITIGDLVADPSGETLLDVLDPTDPDFVEAALACQDEIGSF